MRLSDPFEMLLNVYDREFGFRPNSFVIKPVHVANGLARALTKRSYGTKALAHTLRRHVANRRLGVDEERHPNDDILKNYAKAFENRRDSGPNLKRLSLLRTLLLDVLGADGAAFDQPDNSSYTLSNERFITKDPSDYRSGQFLARLLEVGHGDADAACLLRELLKSENDGWTTLALPLLNLGEVREENPEGEAAKRAAMADPLFEVTNGHLKSPTLAILRDSYDRLARFERSAGSKLNSLRRLVLFGCFALHVHAISRWHERNQERPRPPILLDMSDGAVRSVRDASRASLRAAGEAIECLVLDCFKEDINEFRVEVGIPGVSKAELREVLLEHCTESAVVEDFETYADQNDRDTVDTLAQAVVDAAFAKQREHPIGSLIELGRRAGFLSPWANSGRGGKLKKRYTATAEFLETLVAATVDPEEPLEFPEFLGRLKTNFGILVGQPEDDSMIRRNNLSSPVQFGTPTSINEEDLRRNVSALRSLLVETGYAKNYADGRTVVDSSCEVHV